jgi:hypothetical protein
MSFFFPLTSDKDFCYFQMLLMKQSRCEVEAEQLTTENNNNDSYKKLLYSRSIFVIYLQHASIYNKKKEIQFFTEKNLERDK